MRLHIVSLLVVVAGLLLNPTVLLGAAAKKGIGYLWANDPTSIMQYNPPRQWSFNSAGGRITITRETTGVYQSFFENLCMGSAARHSFAIASAYGPGDILCNVVSWDVNPSDLGFLVEVNCFTLAGVLVDALFTLQVLCNS